MIIVCEGAGKEEEALFSQRDRVPEVLIMIITMKIIVMNNRNSYENDSYDDNGYENNSDAYNDYENSSDDTGDENMTVVVIVLPLWKK